MSAFPLKYLYWLLGSYSDFQISDGVGGNAKAQADAVFVTPFKGQDLSKVSQADRDAVETMREAAEQAETDQFNPQIDDAKDKATGTLGHVKDICYLTHWSCCIASWKDQEQGTQVDWYCSSEPDWCKSILYINFPIVDFV